MKVLNPIGKCKGFKQGSHLHLVVREDRACLCNKFVSLDESKPRGCRNCGGFEHFTWFERKKLEGL